MKLLSFDVGIKNLAYCLFDIDESKNFTIIEWNTISLLAEPKEDIKCDFVAKTLKKRNKKCEKKAIYKYGDVCYCKAHTPKNLLLPIKNISKYKKEELQQIINHHGDISRADIIKKIQLLMLVPIKKPTIKTGSNDTCLIDIGRKIATILGTLFESHELDCVIIENQISTIATRMKSIQCMITQFFIIKHPYANIEFISSANKLKMDVVPHTIPTQLINGLIHITPLAIGEKVETTVEAINEKVETTVETTNVVNCNTTEENIVIEKGKVFNKEYKIHKTDSIKYCKEYLMTDDPEMKKSTTILFNDSKKKDDLADSFLQGVWYIKHKL